MADTIQEAILLRPRCSTCGTEKPKGIAALSGWNQYFFCCPNCWEKCCNACFKADPDGNGTTFFCPHCKQLLKFP